MFLKSFFMVIFIRIIEISSHLFDAAESTDCISHVDLKVSDSINIYKGEFLNSSCKFRKFRAIEVNLKGIESYAFSNVDIIDITIEGNNLSMIRNYTFVNFEVLGIYLKHNRISIIQEKSFINVSGLRFLDLSVNYIYEIDSKSFCNTHVLFFNTSFNNLQNINKNCFKLFDPNENILLIAHNNDIKQVEDDAFVYIHNGTILNLDLSSNKIEKINKKVFQNVIIKERLCLSYNPIKEIPETIYEQNLTILECLKCVDLVEENVKLIKVWVKRNGYFFDYSNSSKIDYFNILSLVILLCIINVFIIN